MIVCEDIRKSYPLGHGTKIVLDGIDLVIRPGERVGFLGRNGAGKTTLIKLIGAVEYPTSGKVTRGMTVSWPLGFGGGFQGSLTGYDNARFIARIYNMDEQQLSDFVEDFAQLGPYFHQPVHTYSAGMNARLAFGISLAIDFDCYLVDEVTGAGDERFRARCEEALLHRRDNATLIMISHDPGTLRQYCRRGAVVYGGALVFFDTIDEASEVHHRLQLRAA